MTVLLSLPTSNISDMGGGVLQPPPTGSQPKS
jgi:hypothetical protein